MPFRILQENRRRVISSQTRSPIESIAKATVLYYHNRVNAFSPLLYELISYENHQDAEVFQDFSGTFFSKDSFPSVPEREQAKAVIPLEHGDGFRAGAAEWGAFGLAIALVLKGHIAPSIVELGSSQGLWCFPWVNVLARKHTKNISALAIEAANAFPEVINFWNLQKHNFQIEKEPESLLFEGQDWKFKWIHGAVTTGAKFVEFPDISVSKNNGASIDNKMGHEITQMIKVRAIGPQLIKDEIKLLSGKETIGLLHLDLQGEELNLMRDAQLGILLQNTSIVVLGTHSHDSTAIALSYFHQSGFTLVSLENCEFEKNQSARLTKDGEQIWIHNDLMKKSVELGLIADIDTITVVSDTLLNLLQEKEDHSEV